MSGVSLRLCDRAALAAVQMIVTGWHYLHKPVDVRSMPEAYEVMAAGALAVGCMIVGRPQATKCYPWYGSVDDVATGRAECTRWQVLNLARVWLAPQVQRDDTLFRPNLLPGFTDRRGVWRSTLATAAIAALADAVVCDYLLRRPPCFLEEPYELRWLLSYCDTRLHRGTIYRAAGFELWRTNASGIQTWRLPLRPLDRFERADIEHAAQTHPRSIDHRARRAQFRLEVA